MTLAPPAAQNAARPASRSRPTSAQSARRRPAPRPRLPLRLECTGTICDAYTACVDSTACDANGDSRVCYCGTGGFTRGTQAYEDFMGTCFGAFSASSLQAGVCRTQVEALSGTNVPIGIGTGWFDPETPLGALNQLSDCSAANCFSECF